MKLKPTHFRYAAYGLLLVCLFVLQTARGTSISLWDGTANYLFPFILSVAMLDGSTTGGVWGLVCGVFLSTVSGGNPIFILVALPIIGGLAGYILQGFMRPNLGSVLLSTGIIVLLWSGFGYVFYGAFIGADWIYVVRSTAVTEGLTLLFTPLVYLGVRHIFRLTKGDGYE